MATIVSFAGPAHPLGYDHFPFDANNIPTLEDLATMELCDDAHHHASPLDWCMVDPPSADATAGPSSASRNSPSFSPPSPRPCGNNDWYYSLERPGDSSEFSGTSPASSWNGAARAGGSFPFSPSPIGVPAAPVNGSPPLGSPGASHASSLVPIASSTPRSLTAAPSDLDYGNGHADQLPDCSNSLQAPPPGAYATADELDHDLKVFFSEGGDFGNLYASEVYERPAAFHALPHNLFAYASLDADAQPNHASLHYQELLRQQNHALVQQYHELHYEVAAWRSIAQRHTHIESITGDQIPPISSDWNVQPRQTKNERPGASATLQPRVFAPTPQFVPNGIPHTGSFIGLRKRPLQPQTLRPGATAATLPITQSSGQERSLQPPQAGAAVSANSRRYPILLKAKPPSGPRKTAQETTVQRRKGGRAKKLEEPTRQKISKMRRAVACWRCKMQRDECDDQRTCGRCVASAQKGQLYFACNRSKLEEFVSDFLPPTMTMMHARQTIEDTVGAEVGGWNRDNPIQVFLTSGYGPALAWQVYEFKPKSQELLGQYQYFRNPETGVSVREYKYSPPLGLMSLDDGDRAHVDNYLDELMTEEYLWDLGWTCFEFDAQSDETAFQPNLLHFMCNLYLETEDDELKNVLQNIIRMMIITYIMGHTLTIVEDTLPSVLAEVTLSDRPKQFTSHTSPRLANRQLKFFFSILRTSIYGAMLKWQHRVFFSSGLKESTWLASFCAMLGFAMVLEEIQCTLQIQADAKIQRGEMAPHPAYVEASSACERIDGRFKFLVDLFQCKYRDKTWVEDGSFGPGTPKLEGLAENHFLKQLRDLVDEKRDYLASRRTVECLTDDQSRYTSRLVARFLFTVLNLPG